MRQVDGGKERVKEYAEKGYTQAVLVNLSKYFDTLNHELLMNLLRKNVKDKRVIDLIKKYLKAGVMENGLLVKTREGSPQGGPLSPLLANIYLNEYDSEEPDTIRNTPMAGLPKWKHTKRVLGSSRKRHSHPHDNK